jgi:hypothetical protein
MGAVREVFISAVNTERGALREAIWYDLVRAPWKAWQQSGLTELDETTLEKLDRYIASSDCVIQLAGRACGSMPDQQSLDWLRKTYSDFGARFPELADLLDTPARTLSLTQWEAWLALYHGVSLLVVGPQDLVDELKTDKLDLQPFNGDEGQRRHLRMLWNRKRYCEPYRDEGALRAMVPETLRRLAERLESGSATHADGFYWPPPLLADPRLAEAEYTGRGWLVERIDQWLDAQNARPLLVLAGFGMGKTATVVELMRRWARRTLVAHFCQSNYDETLKPGLIVLNIATQLGRMIPAYRLAIEASKTLQHKLEQAEERPTEALKDAVFDVLRRLDPTERPRECILLLDGLDESLEIMQAPGQGAAKATTLVDLVINPSIVVPAWIRILVTSRPIDRLKSAEIGRHFSVFDLDEAAGEHALPDVTLYVQGRAATEPAVQEFLEHAGRSAEDLAQLLSGMSAGRFLLVRYVLDDIRDGRIVAQQFDKLPVHVGDFYERTFNWRISRAGLDPHKLLSLLALIAELRAPQSASTLARILPGVSESDVLLVFEAFSGLLKKVGDEGIDFAHWSLEEWLDNKGQSGFPTPREFRIDRAAARHSLVDHCVQLTGQTLEETDDFRPYLERYGVRLLVEQGAFASALELLNSLRAELRRLRRPSLTNDPAARANLEQFVPKQTDLTIDYLRARWRAIDDLPEHKQDALRAPLAAIAPDLLQELLYDKVYQTGKYVPVIRVLVECHWDDWQGIEESLLSEPEEADIVFRHDAGVAYAKAWHAAGGRTRKDFRARLMDKVEALARSDATDRREIAGYALKYICERTERRTWWGPLLPRLKELAQHFAHSDMPTDRMVAGEMLLALAIQGERVTNWFADSEGKVPFWNGYWPNHRADVSAMRALLGEAAPPGDGEGPESLATCRALDQLAGQIGTALRASHLFSATPFGLSYAPLLDGHLAQQSHAEAFDFATVRALATALQGPDRDDVMQFISYLMLHPLWNATERGSTLLASIVRRDPNRVSLIEDLAASAGSAWRICYGAIDAAYDCGSLDKYATFFRLLLRHGREPSCRVRGICIDDLNGWIRDAESDDLEARLCDPETVSLIRYWLEHADDIWLLEYLHEMFNDLQQIKRWSDERISQLMGGPGAALSRYIGDAGFYRLDADQFVARVERLRRAEWELGRQGAGGG